MKKIYLLEDLKVISLHTFNLCSANVSLNWHVHTCLLTVGRKICEQPLFFHLSHAIYNYLSKYDTFCGVIKIYIWKCLI